MNFMLSRTSTVFLTCLLFFLQLLNQADADTGENYKKDLLLVLAKDSTGIKSAILSEAVLRITNSKSEIERKQVLANVQSLVSSFDEASKDKNWRIVVDSDLGKRWRLDKNLISVNEVLEGVGYLSEYGSPGRDRLSDFAAGRLLEVLNKNLPAITSFDREKLLQSLNPMSEGLSSLKLGTDEERRLLNAGVSLIFDGTKKYDTLTKDASTVASKLLKLSDGRPVAGSELAQFANVASFLLRIGSSRNGVEDTRILDSASGQLAAASSINAQFAALIAAPPGYSAVPLAISLVQNVGLLNSGMTGQGNDQISQNLLDLTKQVREKFNQMERRFDKLDSALADMQADLEIHKRLNIETVNKLNTLVALVSGVARRLDVLEDKVIEEIKLNNILACEAYLLPKSTRPSSQTLNTCLMYIAELANLSPANGWIVPDFKKIREDGWKTEESVAEEFAIQFGDQCHGEFLGTNSFAAASCAQKLLILAAILTGSPELQKLSRNTETVSTLRLKSYAARVLVELDRRWGDENFQINIRSQKTQLDNIAKSLNAGTDALKALRKYAHHMDDTTNPQESNNKLENLAYSFLAAHSNAVMLMDSAGDIGPYSAESILLQETIPCRLIEKSRRQERLGDQCWMRLQPNAVPRQKKIGESEFLTKIMQSVPANLADQVTVSCTLDDGKTPLGYGKPCGIPPSFDVSPLTALDEKLAKLLTLIRRFEPAYSTIGIFADQKFSQELAVQEKGIVTHSIIVSLGMGGIVSRYAYPEYGNLNMETTIKTPIEIIDIYPGGGEESTAQEKRLRNQKRVGENVLKAIRSITNDSTGPLWARTRYLWAPEVTHLTFSNLDNERNRIISQAVGWGEALNALIVLTVTDSDKLEFLTESGVYIGRSSIENFKSCASRISQTKWGTTAWEERFVPSSEADQKHLCGKFNYWDNYFVERVNDPRHIVKPTFRFWFEGESLRLWSQMFFFSDYPSDSMGEIELGKRYSLGNGLVRLVSNL